MSETQTPPSPSYMDCPFIEPSETPPRPTEDIVREIPAGDILSPRHRRLCQLLALGIPRSEVIAKVGYTSQRITQLLGEPKIINEIQRLQDMAFEGDIKKRMKDRQHEMLDVMERQLSDPRVKAETKVDIAKWWLEKVTGKATQTHDVGENLLSVMLDRLDGLKQAGQVIDVKSVTPIAALVDSVPATPDPVAEARAKLDAAADIL